MSETIQKLEPNTTYSIYSFRPIESKFGKTYVLEDNDFNKYWANNKITQYINRSKFKIDPFNNKLLFKIKTGNYKTYIHNDKEIKFLEMNIFN